MKNYQYDIVVIGAGSGGISSANLALNLGKKVALVEKRRIGGECTWSGCVPSKALIRSAEIAHGIKNAEKFGLKWSGPPKLNTKNVMSYVRSIIRRVYEEETPEIFEESGINVFIGSPVFLNSHQIRVGDDTITSKKFIIATGSSPFVPPIEGIESVPYLTNETIFELEILPDSMIVLGGGPIGVEMAAALNRLGVTITLIEKSDHILARDDTELTDILTEQLIEEGVALLTNTTAAKLAQSTNGVAVTVKSESGKEEVMESENVLVALGRRPNVNGMDLGAAGVTFSSKGISVNPALQTSAKNIYAIGDVIGSYQFSHIAEYQATVAVPNAVLPIPIKRKVDYTNIVWATFTDPELAHAGYTESEAREKFGESIKIYRYEYKNVDRAKTDLAETGLAKFVLNKKGEILGIHILGKKAADLLHEAQLAKTLGAPFHKISSMIHIYPTLGDVLKRPSGQYYGDRLRDNLFIKLIKKVSGK